MPRMRTPAASRGAAGRRPRARGGRPTLGRLLEALELPGDLVLDVPRLTVVGALQLTVENHRGLVEYQPDRVSIAVAPGRIRVEGEDLEIGIVAAQEVTVLGRLRQITFLRDER